MDTRFQEEEGEEEGRGCFERRSWGALLALRLGLRHASRLREATWAWRSRGESAQPLLQWRSGEWQGIPACLTCQSSWLGDPESGRVWRWPSVALEQGRTVLIDENRPREDVRSCFKEKTKSSRWISRWLNVHQVISASKQDRRILGGTLMVAKSKTEGFVFVFFSAERQIEICMIRFEHCSSPQLDSSLLPSLKKSSL